MALRSAISSRKLKAHTPFVADAWERWLHQADLSSKYPSLVHSIRFGFDIGVPTILSTHTPLNSHSLLNHQQEFSRIVQHEFDRGRYIGPFTRQELESIIGPFQTSPLSLVPKPHKPHVYRLVQNYSYPHAAVGDYQSINAQINSDDFPCTWGTFNAMVQLILHLPPGSQGAVRDVSEAYRNVPVKPEQWAGMVVRLSNDRDEYVLDTQGFFGGSGCAGTYGLTADSGADIMRFSGLGPVIKWVDDHNFFRILREYIAEYNEKRKKWAQSIQSQGGEHRSGGRIWYGGRIRKDGSVEEFHEDMAFPIQDLSQTSERSEEDARFSCNLDDIDRISSELGIPWEKEKDQPWSSTVIFTGFVWDIENKTVTITESKRIKYLHAIETWQRERTHDLKELQKLYGKLLHASQVIRAGRAYLVHLESMLGIFRDKPFMKRTPPRGSIEDLNWWHRTLSSSPSPRRLIDPDSFIILSAFSDASSGVGIGICINTRWRAWRLAEGWKSQGRDIGWAEAVGFELLVCTIIACSRSSQNFVVYGDNQGVVQGWKNGRSRSQAVNRVFKRIHRLLDAVDRHVHVEYIPSGKNPADGPSRGVFPPRSLLLPAVGVPPEEERWILPYNFDATAFSSNHPRRFSQSEFTSRRGQAQSHHSAPDTRQHDDHFYLSKSFKFTQ